MINLYFCSVIKPKRMTTDEKLDLILSRLDSMENRMTSMENKLEQTRHEISLIKFDVKKIFIELEKINSVIQYSEMTRNQDLLRID